MPGTTLRAQQARRPGSAEAVGQSVHALATVNVGWDYGPTGEGQISCTMRWTPAINAVGTTFGHRLAAAGTC